MLNASPDYIVRDPLPGSWKRRGKIRQLVRFVAGIDPNGLNRLLWLLGSVGLDGIVPAEGGLQVHSE